MSARGSEYFIYTRRSTDDIVNQKNSIEYQVKQCVAYANAQRLTVTNIFVEGFCEKGVVAERHTAYKTNSLVFGKDGVVKYRIERPKFQILVSRLAANEQFGVICLCWDRLSRNPHDDSIIKDLINRGVDIRFVQASYDQSSSGALHMDIDGMFAAHYSRVTSEKIRSANAKLRGEGKCTNRAPLGYLNKGTADKPLDPARAPIIKKMFELYAEGNWSVSQLTKWANEQGLTTAPQRARRTPAEILAGESNQKKPYCGPVTVKGIEKLLKNPFYAGVLASRSGYAEIKSVYEPLISTELFRRVQLVHAGRTTSVHHLDRPFFLFRGFVKCGCTRAYSPYEQKGFPYYTSQCKFNCENDKRTIGENRLNGFFKSVRDQIPLTNEEFEYCDKNASSFFSQESKRRDQQSEELENRAARLQKDRFFLRDNKLTLLREGTYSASDFAQEVLRIETELDELEKQKEVLRTTEPEEMYTKVKSFLELFALANDSYDLATPEEKHAFLSSVILELTVVNGELANVKARGVFDRLLKRHVSSQCAHEFVFLELQSLYLSIKQTELQLNTTPIVPLSSSSLSRYNSRAAPC